MRIIKHTTFWVLVMITLAFAFGHQDKSYVQSFYFVSILLPVIIGLNYFFNYFLVPRYLLKRKYGLMALYSFYTLIVSLYLEMLVLTLAFIMLANYRYENLNPAATQVFLLCFVLYSIVFLNAFVLLVKRNFKDEGVIRELEETSEKSLMESIVVRADRKNQKILLEEINYLESLSDYVRIHVVSSPPIITKEKISHLEKKLPPPSYGVTGLTWSIATGLILLPENRFSSPMTNYPSAGLTRKKLLIGCKNQLPAKSPLPLQAVMRDAGS